MALERKTQTTTQNTKSYTNFTIVCKVIKLTKDAMLVRRFGHESLFWIDLNKKEKLPEEGDNIECVISISTYIGKNDNLYRSKLRLLWFRHLGDFIPKDDDLTFWGGRGEYTIKEICKTEIQSLHILKLEAKKGGHTFYARYSDVLGKPTLGRVMLDLELISTSTVFNTEGLMFEDKYIEEYEKDGQKIAVEKKRWYPTLMVSGNMLELESHGEGDSSESI